MDSRGSNNDNPFIEIVIHIGETLLDVFKRLGLTEDDAKEAVLLSSAAVSGSGSTDPNIFNADLWQRADATTTVKIPSNTSLADRVMAAMDRINSASSEVLPEVIGGSTGSPTSTASSNKDYFVATQNLVPVRTGNNGPLTGQYVNKSFDENGDGDYDDSDRLTAEARARRESETVSYADTSGFESADAGTYAAPPSVIQTNTGSGTSTPSYSPPAPQPAPYVPPVHYVTDDQLPDYAKWTPAQWEKAKLDAVATIADNGHSVALPNPDGGYSGVFITKDFTIYTPTGAHANGLNDQQQAWYDLHSSTAIPDSQYKPKPAAESTNPEPPTAPPVIMNPQIPNEANWTQEQWQKAKLDAMATIGPDMHSVALPNPDGGYSGVFITKDGNVYTPTGSHPYGLNDQQQAWYDLHPEITIPGSQPSTPGPIIPDAEVPNLPGATQWTAAEWEQAKLDAMASVPEGRHSAPLTNPDGTYSGVFITKDGIMYTPTDTDNDGLNDQQQAFMTEQAMKNIQPGQFGAPVVKHDTENEWAGYSVDRQGNRYFSVDANGNQIEDHQEQYAAENGGTPNPAPDPTPDPDPQPNTPVNNLPRPSVVPTGWDSFSGDQWQQAMQNTMNSIPSNRHSAPLPKPDGSYSDVFITKDGNIYTPTDTNGDGLNDQQQAFMTEQAMKNIQPGDFGAPVVKHDTDNEWTGYYVDRQGNIYWGADNNNNNIEDHQEQYAAENGGTPNPAPDPTPDPTPDPDPQPNTPVNNLPRPSVVPTGWDSFSGDQWQQAMTNAMNSIPNGRHSTALPKPDGSYSDVFITKDGILFTPVDNDGNSLEDHQEAFMTEQAMGNIADGQFGAPVVKHDSANDWAGYSVDRQGNKFFSVDANGNQIEDHQEQYQNAINPPAEPAPPQRDLYAESMARITNGHSGPLYDENGNQTGQYIDIYGNVFTPTWDQGPLNNARPDLVDQTERLYIQNAVPGIGWDLNGAKVNDNNNNWLGYYTDRDGNAYYPTNDGSVPYSVANNAYEDHDEYWAATHNINLGGGGPLQPL